MPALQKKHKKSSVHNIKSVMSTRYGAGNRTRTCTLLAVEPKSTESTNSTMPANEEVENVKLKIESYCFAGRTMLVSILGIANTLFQPFLSMRRALRPNFPLSIFNFQLKATASQTEQCLSAFFQSRCSHC